jgi:hypothetical protein
MRLLPLIFILALLSPVKALACQIVNIKVQHTEASLPSGHPGDTEILGSPDKDI